MESFRIQIVESTIKKLEHHLEEIRDRTLIEILKTFNRAIENDIQLELNSILLFSSLVKYCEISPISKEDEAIDLLSKLIKGTFHKDLVAFYGTNALNMELSKIRRLLFNIDNIDIISDLIIQLSENVDGSSENHYVESLDLTPTDDGELLQNMENLKLKTDFVIDEDFVQCWTLIDPKCKETMNKMIKSLGENNDQIGFDHIRKYLESAITDYPAEYFLQPPYLIDRLEETLNNTEQSDAILSLLLKFIISYKNRLNCHLLVRFHQYDPKRVSYPKDQKSTEWFCKMAFTRVLQYFRDHLDSTNQESSYMCHEMLQELVNITETIGNVNLAGKLLNELGAVVNCLRNINTHSNHQLETRLNYIVLVNRLVQLGVVFIRSSSPNEDTFISSQWFQELEYALFDPFLQYFYPEIHYVVKEFLVINSKERKDQFATILECDKYLIPLNDILTNANRLTNEEIIRQGKFVIDSMLLHKDPQAIRIIFKSIVRSLHKLQFDESLRSSAEKIILKLLTCECEPIKMLSYRLCAKEVKSFSTKLVDGNAFLSKIYTKSDMNQYIYGIPLNADILTEILSVGCVATSSQIQQNAKEIMILLLNSQQLLGEYWDTFSNLFIPVTELLICYASFDTPLGKRVLHLADLDVLNYDGVEAIKMNFQMMFHKDDAVRQLAKKRLMFFMSIIEIRHMYVPKMDQFLESDIPDNFCILNEPVMLKGPQPSHMSIVQFHDLLYPRLNDETTHPDMRHSILMQAYAVCDDPEIINFMDIGPYLLIILQICHALEQETKAIYLESALPAIGIMSKYAQQSSKFRHLDDFKKEDFCLFIIRALILRHGRPEFKENASILLFLILFTKFIIGNSGTGFQVPKPFQNLAVPFFAKYYQSFYAKSELEQILYPSENESNLYDAMQQNEYFDVLKDNEVLSCYLKVNFNFISLKDVMSEFVMSKFENSLNQSLMLTETELGLLKTTSTNDIITILEKRICNASNTEDFIDSMSTTRLLLRLINSEKVSFKPFWNSISRIVLNIPKNPNDQLLYCKSLQLFGTFIEAGNINAIDRLIKILEKEDNVFMLVLRKNYEYSKVVFLATIKLLEEFLVNVYDSKAKGVVQKIFDCCWFLIEMESIKSNIDFLKPTINLIRLTTASELLDHKNEECDSICNKLLFIMSQIKAFGQSGSTLNKNCLLAIMNISSNCDEFTLNDRLLNMIVGICGHSDPEIRAYSWCILAKMTESKRQSEFLINALYYLPGGFHACCLSTLMDDEESSVVREAAGTTFANIISFTGENNKLSELVAPKCKEQNDKEHDALSLLDKVVMKQRYFERFQTALSKYSIIDVVMTENTVIVGSDFVRVCIHITSKLLYLNVSILDKLIKDDFLSCLSKIIVRIPTNVCDSSALLLVEICDLLLFSCLHNEEVYKYFTSQDRFSLQALLMLMNPEIFSDVDESVNKSLGTKLPDLLKILLMKIDAYQQFINILDFSVIRSITLRLEKGFTVETQRDIQISSLRLLITILEMDCNLKFDRNEQNFIEKLDGITSADILHNTNISNDNQSSLENNFSGSEMLLNSLLSIMKYLQDNSKPLRHDKYNQAMFRDVLYVGIGEMIKRSQKARMFAIKSHIVDDLIEYLINIHIQSQESIRTDFNKLEEYKRNFILSNLMGIFGVITNLFKYETLSDEKSAKNLIEIIKAYWPWIKNNYEVKSIVLEALVTATESSIIACKFLALCPTSEKPLLKIVYEVANKESDKVKGPLNDLVLLQSAIRLLTNSCSVIEARNTLTKLNIASVLDRFHPNVMKQNRIQHSIAYLWLQFYEIFTRYESGQTTKQLSLLSTFVVRSSEPICSKALNILWNIASEKSNKSTLLASDDYKYALKEILKSNDPLKQKKAIFMIWNLIANNYKGKHIIKNSSLMNFIKSLHETLKKRTELTSSESDCLTMLHNIESILNK